VSIVLTAIEALGLLAVLVGVALALPLWGSLIVDGLLVVVAATAAELVVRKAHSAPSDRRSGPSTAGGV
jgi:hypothetical protein